MPLICFLEEADVELDTEHARAVKAELLIFTDLQCSAYEALLITMSGSHMFCNSSAGRGG